jgi:hypothetical protein
VADTVIGGVCEVCSGEVTFDEGAPLGILLETAVGMEFVERRREMGWISRKSVDLPKTAPCVSLFPTSFCFLSLLF